MFLLLRKEGGARVFNHPEDGTLRYEQSLSSLREYPVTSWWCSCRLLRQPERSGRKPGPPDERGRHAARDELEKRRWSASGRRTHQAKLAAPTEAIPSKVMRVESGRLSTAQPSTLCC